MAGDSDPALYEQALRCFSSWVQFGIPLTDVEHVVPRLVQALQNDTLFDTSVEALVSVFSHQENYRY